MRYQTYTEWLSELKTGDTVLFSMGTAINNYSVETIVRMTATQLVLSNGRKMRKQDGRETGNRMNRLSKPLPERLERLNLA